MLPQLEYPEKQENSKVFSKLGGVRVLRLAHGVHGGCLNTVHTANRAQVLPSLISVPGVCQKRVHTNVGQVCGMS